MQKKLIITTFLVVFFTLILTSCKGENGIGNNAGNIISNKNPKDIQGKTLDGNSNNSSEYEVAKETYSRNGVKINYPQVKNLNDSNKQKAINELIKNEALKVLSYYSDDNRNLTLEINYGIKLKNPNLLSIQYSGVGNVEGSAHPNNIFYTTNININRAIKLTLKDIVNIDKNFIEKFRKGIYTKFDPDLDVEKESKEEVNNYTDAELIGYFNKADNISTENELNAFSYLTKDSLGISVSVPHPIGDHSEFEIKYKDILDNMKRDVNLP